MEWGIKQKIAQHAAVSPQFFGRLLKCHRHASLPVADRLAILTGTTSRLWQLGGGGTPEARRAAVEAYAARVGESVERAFKSKARYKGSGL